MMFTEHTLESAPAASRKSMEVTIRHLGRLTSPVARMATSPHLLDGFLTAERPLRAEHP